MSSQRKGPGAPTPEPHAKVLKRSWNSPNQDEAARSEWQIRHDNLEQAARLRKATTSAIVPTPAGAVETRFTAFGDLVLGYTTAGEEKRPRPRQSYRRLRYYRLLLWEIAGVFEPWLKSREAVAPERQLGFDIAVANCLRYLLPEDVFSTVALVRFGRMSEAAAAVAWDRLSGVRGDRPPLSRYEVGQLIGLTKEQRRNLDIRLIYAIDETAEERVALKLERRRRRKRDAARAKGSVPRAEYEADSAERNKPWVKLGMSRRSWYRKGKPMIEANEAGTGTGPHTLEDEGGVPYLCHAISGGGIGVQQDANIIVLPLSNLARADANLEPARQRLTVSG
jgi:hypothetical protein